MGSTAKKLMGWNSLDDDFASDVKKFYILLFFLIAWCTFFCNYLYIYLFFSFFLCMQFPGILVIIAGLAI